MEDAKPYCREGESDSSVALAWAIIAVVTFFFGMVGAVSLFL